MRIKSAMVPLAMGGLIGAACLQHRLRADDSAPRDPPVVTRTYDIQDLLVFPNAPGGLMDGAATTKTSQTQPSTQPSTRQLVAGARRDAIASLIEATVDPDSWGDKGGEAGITAPFGGAIVVVQTEKNQKAIAELLHQLRLQASRTVALRVIWAELSKDQLAGLTTPLQPGDANADIAPLRLVDISRLEKLKLQPKAMSLHFLCADGQEASAHGVGGAGPGGVVGNYAMTIQPTLRDKDGALLSIQARWSAAKPASGEGEGIDTTLTLPLGKAMLVGAMSPPDGAADKQLCLIVEITGGAPSIGEMAPTTQPGQ